MTVKIKDDEIRDRIVAAIEPHVVFDGWSQKSFAAAARDVGLDNGAPLRVFPTGAIAAIDHYFYWGDRLMQETLASQYDLTAMKTKERIIVMMKIRINLFRSREIIRRTLPILIIPSNVSTFLKSVYRTADTIWFSIDDTATDITFYTKRMLLASVYMAALFYWLDDDTKDYSDTYGFIERSITKITQLATFFSHR